jgi:hypothetical protein
MNLVERITRRWQEYTGEEDAPFDGDTPAWVVSLAVHVVVLLALALAGLGAPPKPARNFTVIEILPPVAEEVSLVAQEFAVAEEPRETAGAESNAGDEAAQPVAPMITEESVVAVEPDLVGDLQLEAVDDIPAADVADASVVVANSAVGVGTTGAAGAVDHLTAEIAAKLEQRPTVVCWLFDQSVSLSAQRQQIADRLDRVFDELGATRSGANRADLTNMVVAFGQSVGIVTRKPTSDVDEVVKAIESIPVDESGAEMTFLAIRTAADAAKVFRTSSPKRNVMIVVFTDEVGNDTNTADATANRCRTLGIPVYVVGVPAPFGLREVRMKYVDPDPKYSQDEQWAVIEQGPETLQPEIVRVRSGRYADEAIDSGFGPFCLSRLCAETGGIYFRVHPNSGARGRVTNEMTAPMSSQLRYFFDPGVMRLYQPDYVSDAKLEQELFQNRAKRALVEAAKMSEIKPMESPEMTFPRTDDGALALLLGEAQKVAARIQPKIDALHATLAAGQAQADRGKIREKRWQAGYDLALGRVLAVKVRTDAYNLMLAQAKSGMKFKDPGHDTWRLEPSPELSVGSQTEKMAKQSTELLERVMREHPGTPWALLAGEELRIPLGYRWTEIHTGVNDAKGPDGNGVNVPNARADEMKRKLAPPKPKRDLKRL